MRTTLAWLSGLLGAIVMIAGAYYFHDEPALTAVRVVGWALLGLSFFLAGPRILALMKLRRRHVDELREEHPGNPNSRSES